MMMKLYQSQAAKAGKEFWSLDQNKLSFFFFYLLILFLPTQLGKHFFPNFSFVYGLRVDYLSPTIYLTDIFILFIFIFSIKEIFKKALTNKRILLYFVIFILFILLGLIASKNPLAGYISILKLLEFIYLGIFVYFNFEKLDKIKISLLLGVGIIFESALALCQYFNQGSFQGILYFLGERNFNSQTPGIANASINGKLILRSYGTFPHPNVLAGYLQLSMILFLGLRKKAIDKYFSTIVLIAGTIGIFISFSRSAIFCFALFAFTYFTFVIVEKYKKGKANRSFFATRAMLVFITLFLLIAIFFNTNILERFTTLKLSDESVIQRQELINASIFMIKNNPVFGVGINNFLNNLKPNFNSPLLLQPVHNIFLLVFSETGLFGFLIFISLILQILKKSLLQKNIYKLAIVLSIIIIGSLDHYLLTIQQSQILLVLLIGYCVSKVN